MSKKQNNQKDDKALHIGSVGERKPIYNDGLRKELDRLKEKMDAALSSSAIRYWQREIDRLKKNMHG